MTVKLYKKYVYSETKELVNSFKDVARAIEAQHTQDRELQERLYPKLNMKDLLADTKTEDIDRQAELAYFVVEADGAQWETFYSWVAEHKPLEACSCFGNFSGRVTSIDPLLVNCGSAGDDCVVIISNKAGKRVRLSGFGQEPEGSVVIERGDTSLIKVGDLAFDLQYGDCEYHSHLSRAEVEHIA